MYAVHGAVDAPHIYLGSIDEYAAVLYSGSEVAFILRQAVIEEYSVLKRAIFFKFTEICLKRAEIIICEPTHFDSVQKAYYIIVKTCYLTYAEIASVIKGAERSSW